MEKSKNSVSVIIPVFNAFAFLERAVQSALIQNEVIEVILVEDGSIDNSFELCKRLSQEYSKVKTVQHPNSENKGPSATRNLGLRFASGTWIQFLDADDELLPEKLSHQLSLVSPNTNLIISNSLNKYSTGKVYPRKFYKDPWVGLIAGKLGITSANLFRKTILEDVGGFDEKLRTSEEYELMFKILKTGSNPVFDERFLTIIHQSGDSICRSGKNSEQLYKNWVNLRKEIRLYLIDINKFRLKERFYYSGALGNFQRIFGRGLDSTVNRFLLLIYDFRLSVKRLIFVSLYGK